MDHTLDHVHFYNCDNNVPVSVMYMKSLRKTITIDMY